MKLNIHLVSHPIIQSLSSIATNKPFPSNIVNYTLKQLGLLVTYETIRNWLKTYTLTIRQTNYKKTITIPDPKESYIIIFNQIHCLNLFQDIHLLLPKCELKLINNENIHIDNSQSITWPDINSHSKIIIINYDLELEYVLSVLCKLTCDQQININQIRLTCITCKTSQLVIIGNKYNKLNIYTTKIINN